MHLSEFIVGSEGSDIGAALSSLWTYFQLQRSRFDYLNYLGFLSLFELVNFFDFTLNINLKP